jgi:hypothetical protein
MREAADELTRLVDRVERLRGLCKSAVGMLHDAGRDGCARSWCARGCASPY